MEQVNIDSNIGITLRRYRRERGITPEELAVAVNMGMATISGHTRTDGSCLRRMS